MPTVCAARRPREKPGLFPGRWLTTIAFAAGLVAGCGDRVEAPPAAEPRQVMLRFVDHDGLLKEVASRRGKVVVLDCWSTSCPPCVKEFPGLVAMAARHEDRVACLSLAFDFDGTGDPNDLIGPIRGFLEKVGAAGITNLLSSEPADSLYRKLDLASVPAVYVWKPDGELAVRFDDDMAARELGRPFTYDDVEKAVAALIAE